jgi:hypothetical protein
VKLGGAAHRTIMSWRTSPPAQPLGSTATVTSGVMSAETRMATL